MSAVSVAGAVLFASFGAAVAGDTATASGELSGDGTVLSVSVESGEATLELSDSHLAALTGNAVTEFVKTGAGTLVVPAGFDISGYSGDITVEGGIYRLGSPRGAGAVTGGTIDVKDGAALELSPEKDVKMNLGAKRVVFAGSGPDGKGAVRAFPDTTEQNNGFIFGTNLVMTGDAVLSSITNVITYIGSTVGLSLDMNGHELELRPYSGLAGRNNQVFNIRHPHIKNPGSFLQTQASVKFEGSLAVFEGDESCVYDISSGGDFGYPSLQFSKCGSGVPWTLNWNTEGSFAAASTNPSATTNENVWTGPVVLNKDMNVQLAYGSDGYAQLTLGGKVSGGHGIKVVCNSSGGMLSDGHFNLVCPENDFTGPVTGRDFTLHLWNSGALPLNGAGVVGTNVTVVAEGNSVVTLPGATLGGDSGILGYSWHWTGDVVKTGDGTLTCGGGGGGERLEVQGGTVAWTQSGVPAFAGVVSGVEFFDSYDDALSAYGSGETADETAVELTPSFAYSATHDYWKTGNALITCKGYLWNANATNETWSFVTAMGRKAKLTVNGHTVCENDYWIPDDAAASRMTCGYGNAVIVPGANVFEFRVCTSAASQGPSCRPMLDNPAWVKSNFGFVVDRKGRNTVADGIETAYNHYGKIEDKGDASFLSWAVPGTDSVYVHPETGEKIVLAPSFSEMAFAPGCVLDCGGFASYAAATVEGFPSVVNCGTFALTNMWKVTASSLGTGVLSADGTLDLSGATLDVADDAAVSVETGTSFVLAEATGITGLPALSQASSEDWTVALSASGDSLVLTRKPVGFTVIVR